MSAHVLQRRDQVPKRYKLRTASRRSPALPPDDGYRRTTARKRTSSYSWRCSMVTASGSLPRRGSRHRRLGSDAAHGQGEPAHVRWSTPLFPGRLAHTIRTGFRRRGAALRGCHGYVRGEFNRAEAYRTTSAQARSASPSRSPAAPARFVARSDLPIIPAATRATRNGCAKKNCCSVARSRFPAADRLGNDRGDLEDIEILGR